jgi:beta-mannosidase
VYGRWKALHYYARRAFAPVLLTAWLEEDAILLHGVNDTLAILDGTLVLRLIDFHGTVRHAHTQPVHLSANGSTPLGSLPAGPWLAGIRAEAVLLHCSLHCDDGLRAEQTLYFCPVKDLALPLPVVDIQVTAEHTGLTVTVSSPELVKTLCLETDTLGGQFSDNYFDLLPGEPRTVQFTPSVQTDAAALKRDLQLWHVARVPR